MNPLCFLVELVGCAPDELMKALCPSSKMVMGLSVSTKRGLREMGAQLYGAMLAYTEDENKFDNTLADLTKTVGHKVCWWTLSPLCHLMHYFPTEF